MIDSPVLPYELDALRSLIGQAGYPEPSGLLATHGDWDHLLGRLAFTGLTLGCAESTAARMAATPGQVQCELRAFDEEHLIERARPLALGAVQSLPVPGRCEIGEHELELHDARGHTEDGMAVWIPWARVLVAGDYLSTVEIPSLEAPHPAPPRSQTGGAGEGDEQLRAYLGTLERLRQLAQDAAHVIPGHGPVLDATRALGTIEEDLVYLRALGEQGLEAELPAGRHGAVQRERHARNVARLGGGAL